MVTLLTALVAGLAGAGVALVLLRPARAGRLGTVVTRVNFRGKTVPVVLGRVLIVSSALVLGCLVAVRASDRIGSPQPRVAIAALFVLLGLGLAGWWDDRRGDERARGFRGHLSSLRQRTLTGGLVKLLAGGAVALVAAALVTPGWAIVASALLIALSANLVNLLDRAPGRASKFSLGAAALIAAVGDSSWAVAAAGVLGALVVTLPVDLGERGMLGDEGANPLGGLLGLGLALALDDLARIVAALVLLALNVASERYSFSEIIARTSWLDALDRFGRAREGHGSSAE